jgi:UDP-N-acetylmuramoyl-tripeptide--D-alanyl-D-alanine ligase
MKSLFEALPQGRRGAWALASDGIAAAVTDTVRGGDVVMIKGSLGSRMAPIVEALLAKSDGKRARS